MIRPALTTVLPSRPLRSLISHYWLSFDNPDATHVVLPDGAVDLVIRQCGASAQSWVYGTSTSRFVVALEQHAHYFGIRFKPGQSRHFMKAAPIEITDRCEAAKGLLRFSLDSVLEYGVGADLFHLLNENLESHICRNPPARTRVDEAISFIEAAHGTARIDEVVAAFGKSRRHLERVFLETVGVSPKFFSSITRFRRAAELLHRPSASLAAVAFEAGYSDQSHMSHEFRRLANLSPLIYARSHVAFLQDSASPVSEDGHS